MADNEHLYFVVYDISDPKRWRSVFRTMNGFGEWVQLSVFQCCLSRVRHAELIAKLHELIHHDEDHLLVVDLGPVDRVEPRIISFGKKSFTSVSREPIIV